MKTELKNTLKEAMLAKDAILVNTIRSILSKITEAEKVNGSELTNDLILKVIEKLAKQREESIDLFKKGNRPDLVESEENQLGILKKYLPEKFSLEKTREIVNEIISHGHTNMGSIMKELSLHGNLIDKKIASNIIKEILV